MVDPRTGAIVLVTSYNSGEVTEEQILRGETADEESRRVFVQTSQDEGRSFSEPREITSAVKRANWRWYATGPGHAVALTRGEHAGRLVVPANHSAAPLPGPGTLGRSPSTTGRMRSTATIRAGPGTLVLWMMRTRVRLMRMNPLPRNCSTAACTSVRGISAGQVPGNRLDAYSDDDGASLDWPYAVQPTLSDVPMVQGSVLQLTTEERGELLFSGPSVPSGRVAMALWSSADGGRSFRKVLTLSSRKAGYSDLVQLDDRTVGILYETGDNGPYEEIAFQRIPVRSLGRNGARNSQ